MNDVQLEPERKGRTLHVEAFVSAYPDLVAVRDVDGLTYVKEMGRSRLEAALVGFRGKLIELWSQHPESFREGPLSYEELIERYRRIFGVQPPGLEVIRTTAAERIAGLDIIVAIKYHSAKTRS